MLTQTNFFIQFQKFITDSKSGKRLNKNGSCIKPQSIICYTYCEKMLQEFVASKSFPLIIYQVKGNNKRQHNMLKKYYAGFYRSFTGYMYKEKNCHDNYVGQNIKQVRTFYGWLNTHAGINTGNYYKSLYVCKEDVPIITLSLEQLKFLIFNKDFESSLSLPLQRSKDIFVFGCFAGLRFSDLMALKSTNIEFRDGYHYLKMRSKKTNVDTMVKLPPTAVAVINKYRKNKKKALPTISLSGFNKNIKKMAALAGWDYPIEKSIHQTGVRRKLKVTITTTRFCDSLSSHTMRRTSITNMLTSGMPEYIVKKISGHSSDSKAFYRYVNLAQGIMDREIDKMHNHFKAPE